VRIVLAPRKLAEVASINHDPCYHRLPYVSNIFIVLVLDVLANLFE
jgi:hypothetical protein